MRFPIVMEYSLLERLTQTPEYENIIIGTGVFARDVRRKLRLLGLKAPFMIGGKADPENEIKHYDEIAALGDPKLYRFIVCCDVDELWLIAKAQAAAYKFMGSAVWLHPQVIRLNTDIIIYESADDYVIDAGNCNVVLRGGRPFVVFGDEHDDEAFFIHILGGCHAGGLYCLDSETYPELLQRKLADAGFRSVVYAYGQPEYSASNNVFSFIRDICFHKIDLVILYAEALNPLFYLQKNVLATRAGGLSHEQQLVRDIRYTYGDKVSNGIDHDTGLPSIRKIQQRIFTAFSKMYDFVFWDIIAPYNAFLPEEQARVFLGRSSGYLARRRQAKDELLSILDEKRTKDYTDTFVNTDDIYSMFADASHLSSKGSDLVAERCAADILAAFGKRRKG